MRSKPKALLVGALVVGASALGACGDDDSPTDDLDSSDATYDRDPRTVYVNYDQFPNVVTWCDGLNQVYATTRASDSLTVIPNSPNCQGGPR